MRAAVAWPVLWTRFPRPALTRAALAVAAALLYATALRDPRCPPPDGAPCRPPAVHAEDGVNALPQWERLGQVGGAPTAIAVEGRLAVLGVAEVVWVVDLTVDNRPRVIGRTGLLGSTVVDLAIVGRTAVAALGDGGLVFIDIAEPTAPSETARLEGVASTLAVAGDRLVACGGHACRIVRVAAEEPPDVVGTVAFGEPVGPVAAEGQRAYVAVEPASDAGSPMLHVVDIADPAGPQTLLTKALVPSAVRGLGVTGSWLYVVQESGVLRAYDLSTEGPPVPRGGVLLPSGVSSTGVRPMAVAGERVYVASGLEVSAVDISQPTAPRFLGATPVDGLVAAIGASPGRVYVANHADLLGGRRAFHGLEILAAAIDGGAQPLGSLDEAWHAYGVALHRERYAVVAAGRSGLRVVDVEAAGGPREIAAWIGAAELVDVVLAGDVAFAADASTGAMLQLIDLSDPALPRAIGALREPAPRASAVVRIGRFVAVGLEPRQLVLLDASDPRAPRHVMQLDLPGATLALATFGSRLYVLTGRPARTPSLLVLDVAADGRVAVRSSAVLDLPLLERSLFGLAAGADAVVVSTEGLVVTLDADGLPPQAHGRLSLPHAAVAVAGSGGRMIAVGGGLSLIDVADVDEPRLIASVPWNAGWPEVRNAVAFGSEIVAAAQWDAGLAIARLSPAGWLPDGPAEPPTAPAPPTDEPTATSAATASTEPPRTAEPTPSVDPTVEATTSGDPTPSSTPSAPVDPTPPTPPTETPPATVGLPSATPSASQATATPRAATATRRPSATARPTSDPLQARTIYLPLLVTEACPPKDVFSDIVLVIDASTSMALLTPGGQQKIDAALDAVWTFLDGLRLQGGGDRAAIVTFNRTAATLQELTGERRRLVSALRRVSLAANSRVDAGILAAAAELSAHGRDTATKAMIVLSDGKANPVSSATVVSAAQSARRMGFGLFVVGIGPDMDAPTLRAMAGVATRFFPAPDPDQLRPIYAHLVRTVPCPASGYWGRR